MKHAKLALILSICFSGCALMRVQKVADATPETIQTISSDELCEVARNHPSYLTTVAREEINSRNLGDCSTVTVKCVAAGFKPGTPAYTNCSLQMFVLEQQMQAANYAARQQAYQQSMLNMQNNIQKIYSPPTRTQTVCSPGIGGDIVCNQW